MNDTEQALLDVRLIQLAANPSIELTETEQRLAVGAMARWLLGVRAARALTHSRRKEP